MTSPNPPATGLKRLYNAFFYSVAGIKAAFRTEEAFRQEILLSFLLVPLGIYLGETGVEKVLLAGSILVVLVIEILNTAIERAIDRISFERHELSKEAKDLGCAAVLLTLILAALTWALILI